MSKGAIIFIYADRDYCPFVISIHNVFLTPSYTLKTFILATQEKICSPFTFKIL